MKGDANIDFIISLTIFITFISLILISLNNNVISEPAKPDIWHDVGYLTSSRLMEYFRYNNKLGTISQAKLDGVTNCTNINLNLTNRFYYKVISKEGDWSCNPGESIGPSLPYIQRSVYVVLNNGRYVPAIMRVWTWKEGT